MELTPGLLAAITGVAVAVALLVYVAGLRSRTLHAQPCCRFYFSLPR